ncbi:MAG: hypothetical protein ABIY52_01470 [Gemmatimonadaceae bacterium]
MQRITVKVRSRATWLLLGALAFGGACSRNTPQDTAAEPVPVTSIKVENQAFLDMTIYVYRSSQRIRLGVATGNSTAKFIIPASLLFGSTPLRFQADPIGRNRQPISQEISVSPGDEVQLIIPPGT